MTFFDRMVLVRRLLTAELIGTFALVFVGAGSVIVESHTGMSHLGIPDGKVGLAGIALAHGLTLMAMIYSLGPISGAHFNPAVSLAFWARQKMNTQLLFGYTLAQLAGAVLAGALLAAIFPDEIKLASLGTPTLAPKISIVKGIIIEALITSVLVLTVLFSTKDEANTAFAGLAIGGVLVALILFAGPITGAAANPARYLGPAIASARLSEILTYLVGPLAGGIFAASLYGFTEIAPPPPAAVENAPAPKPPVIEEKLPTDGAPLGPEAYLARAHQLFFDGKRTEAAEALLPLLARFEEQEDKVKDSLRSLSLVIEDSLGGNGPLGPYRTLLRGAD